MPARSGMHAINALDQQIGGGLLQNHPACATDLLVKSIYRVHAGEIWLDNRMTAEVMKAFAKSSDSGPRREKPLLSDREKEIVQLVAQGYRNKEIGEKLFISEQTVKNHLHNIFDKLGVSDRLELALYAIHHRLIDQS